jgi:hypothetical protein
MRNDFAAIPPEPGRRDAGSVLTRIYHDIGLAAVAEALNLPPGDFDLELKESLQRGEFYLLPSDPALAPVGAPA